MSLVNRRNAVLGWAVWLVAKQAAKRKVKQTVSNGGSGGGRRRLLLIPLALAAAVAGVVAWRSRTGGTIELADGAPPPSTNGAGDAAPKVVRDATEPASADPVTETVG
jgi:hypothetical protein